MDHPHIGFGVGPPSLLQPDVPGQTGNAMRIDAPEIGAEQSGGRGDGILRRTAHVLKDRKRKIMQLFIGDNNRCIRHALLLRDAKIVNYMRGNFERDLYR